MFGYFFRYFVARASYDAIRANAHRRLANAAIAEAQRRQRIAAPVALQAPTLDDNLLAIGRRHAALGMKLKEVEACYGPGEELPSTTRGIDLRAYALNSFCVCVSFWKGRSYQETWSKAGAEKKAIESGELMALLENKTPGHPWSPLKSSSKRLWWWASPLGLVACFEIRESAQSLLHIADPSRGAPSAMPALPAAALPSMPPPPKRRLGRKLLFACFVIFVLFVLYSLNRGSTTRPAPTPEPTVLRALPVETPDTATPKPKKRSTGTTGTIGISHFAQSELGDIVYVDINSIGDDVAKDGVFGTIEAVKTVSDLYMPISGKITEMNPGLDANPESVNKDPYGAGWLVKVEITNPADLNGLMDAEAYKKHIGV